MAHLQGQSPNLIISGPTIEVLILPSKPVQNFLLKSGGKIPVAQALALIDTGASGSCIDKSIVQMLKLQPHNSTTILHPKGASTGIMHDIDVVLAISRNTGFRAVALEADLTKQPYKALIGRDILKNFTLVYNGWNNSYTLHL